MARYTIEDVELLRKKSGISYEEAINLLEYHNGDVAKALVDLERNGRINPEKAKAYHKEVNGKKAMGILTRLYRCRITVKKQDVVILNLSVLFSALSLLISPHLVIIGLILVLILGYRLGFKKDSPDFEKDSFDNIVHNAAQNVKQTVSSFARDISGDSGKTAASEPSGSYYQSQKSGAAPVDQTAPAKDNTTPVNVNCHSEGTVETSQTDDGYNQATIQ